jgi:hypothetical protein
MEVELAIHIYVDKWPMTIVGEDEVCVGGWWRCGGVVSRSIFGVDGDG